MNDARAAFLLRAPGFTELAVRTALGDAIRAQRAAPGPVDVRAFGNRALAVLRSALQRSELRFDSLAVHEVEASTLEAAARFLTSPLGRRLFALQPADVRAAAGEADVVVTAGGALHAVRLECCRDDDARMLVAQLVSGSTGGSRAGGPRVHLFSLRDGRLRGYRAGEPQRRRRPA